MCERWMLLWVAVTVVGYAVSELGAPLGSDCCDSGQRACPKEERGRGRRGARGVSVVECALATDPP